MRYSPDRKGAWDEFIARSKNGTFLFRRDYMDYHADRFDDHSLMTYRGDRLIGLLPANRAGDALVSHGGLTYGGWVTDERMRAGTMLNLFAALAEYAGAAGLRRVMYKPVPHIYHRAPAEEDLYALFRFRARLVRRDVSSVIRIAERLPLTKGRKSSLKLARANSLNVGRSDAIEEYMEVEAALLQDKYGVQPTHTPSEMRLLADRFPENIKLFGAHRSGSLVGGVLIYETPRVAHAQYIAATDDGRDLGALDAVLDLLLNDVYRDKPYFDFGISTEQDGRYLNEGLIENKESYGARAVVYDRYELLLDAAEAAAAAGPVRAAADLSRHQPAAD